MWSDFFRDTQCRSVAGHRHRVDRIDRPAGLSQCGDQQPARGLDGHGDRILCRVPRLGQQREQLGETLQGVTDAALGEEFALSVDQSNVVVAFGPVDSAEHLHSSPTFREHLFFLLRHPDENAWHPNDEALGLPSD